MEEAHKESLIKLLTHEEPAHRHQGVVLLHSLGIDVAAGLFNAPRVVRDRPSVSLTKGYLLTEEMLAAWVGPDAEPWSWAKALISLDLAGQFHLKRLDPLRGMPQLEVLKLRSCVHLSDLGSLRALTALRRLDLSRCAQITSLRGIEACTNLEEVRLKACISLCDISALSSCHALKMVDLRDADEVKEIDALAGLPALTHVYLPRSVDDLSPLVDCPALTHVSTGPLWGARKTATESLPEHVTVVEN